MEILNILYNNNFIAFYLIGAILVVILIFIVLSSMTTTSKNKETEIKEEILKDPTENDNIPNITNITEEQILEEKKEMLKDIPRINDIVEDLYNQKINEEPNEIEENQDLNSFLEEFEVPNNIIKEVINEEEPSKVETEEIKENIQIEEKQEETIHSNNNSENIESMLKRLYDLRQTENDAKKTALLNEIYDLKKQVDETLKAKDYNYALNYNEVDTKALADYYLFNEDIEFPKLK